jgi:hypothetical protein
MEEHRLKTAIIKTVRGKFNRQIYAEGQTRSRKIGGPDGAAEINIHSTSKWRLRACLWETGAAMC